MYLEKKLIELKKKQEQIKMANRIQGTTRLIGLLGTPIKHSRSQ